MGRLFFDNSAKIMAVDGKILVEDILRLGAAMELEEAEKEHSTSVSS